MAIVDGADDFSDKALWRKYHKKVWLAEGVTWDPQQVFDNGVRLVWTDRNTRKLDPGEYRYVEGAGLYVNVGGDNPGDHDLRVGRRSHGFRLSGRSWVSIEGFTLRHSDDKGILIQDGHDITVVNNTVTRARKAGISVIRASKVRIASNVASDNGDHGIAFVNEVTGSTIEDNTAFGNARPELRAANGIYLYGSVGNLVQRNRTYDNQDTGLQIARDANDNVLLQNESWNNGDHGVDCVRATGTIQIGNVVWGNYRDGISLEGAATGSVIRNCIAAENGLETDHFDFYVDAESVPGLVSDYNIFWNSTAQEPISVGGWRYADVRDFASASGTDAHSIQADPLFVDAAAGEFYLRSGSPAIDSGDSSPPQWPATDADKFLRFDDPASANLGSGPMLYADRGAREYFTRALAVGDGAANGAGVKLSMAYPNPSAAGVALNLELPRATRVTWSVHDLQGRSLVQAVETREAGRSILRWNGAHPSGSRVLPGIYFVRVDAAGAVLTRRVALMN